VWRGGQHRCWLERGRGARLLSGEEQKKSDGHGHGEGVKILVQRGAFSIPLMKINY
jgi:hypothetical protein